jgi:RimJ/RimL family protein N-acetyltransferase
MLLSGRAMVAAPSEPDLARGFIVIVKDAALMSVVGRPPASVIRHSAAALRGDVNALAQLDDAERVEAALRGWTRQPAIIHVLPDPVSQAWAEDPNVRVFTRQGAPAFDHVPEPLRRELLDALDGRTTSRFVPGALPHAGRHRRLAPIPMSAVWADGRPVSFCYPVWQTETLWDVAIDTLEPYRGRGLAVRAARTLIRWMRRAGREPVWSALEANAASRALAARLGFIEAAGLAVFSAGRPKVS